MNQFFKGFFALVVLTLLLACNSEGAFTFEVQPPVDETGTEIVIEITVTPSPVSVLKGRTQQLAAIAKFDNGQEIDISDSTTWTIVGDPTIADVSASGLLTGNAKGDTELTATRDGITSNTVNLNVCNLAGACIDIVDTGSGKLFTNSPSVAYLNSIGGSTTDGTYPQTEIDGPTGDFYLFNWANANALCATYNTKSIAGRTNWRLATKDELKMDLFDRFGDMFNARGWPTHHYYWSVIPDGYYYYYVLFRGLGDVRSNNPSTARYASCVSNP